MWILCVDIVSKYHRKTVFQCMSGLHVYVPLFTWCDSSQPSESTQAERYEWAVACAPRDRQSIDVFLSVVLWFFAVFLNIVCVFLLLEFRLLRVYSLSVSLFLSMFHSMWFDLHSHAPLIDVFTGSRALKCGRAYGYVRENHTLLHSVSETYKCVSK